MSNHITASVEFYYKGEKFAASIELDLDQQMESSGCLPDLYGLLAASMNIGIYSYEYEMLQAETILFGKAKGLAIEYVKNGLFDVESFKDAWNKNTVLDKLQEIAKRNLSVNNLNQQGELKKALMEAYRLGESAVRH